MEADGMRDAADVLYGFDLAVAQVEALQAGAEAELAGWDCVENAVKRIDWVIRNQMLTYALTLLAHERGRITKATTCKETA